MVTLIFIFDPSSGQKRSNFEAQKFPFKTYLSCPILSQDSKYVICSDVRQLEMPKMPLWDNLKFWISSKKKDFVDIYF